MSTAKLEAQPRTIVGRQVKQIRNQGMVPVVIYGKTQTPENIQVDSFTFERLLSSGASSQLLEVEIAGVGKRNVLIRHVQRDPVRNNAIHADFYAVSMTEKQHVSVPVVSIGKTSGLGPDVVLVQALDHVEIEALPSDIPAHVEVDISRLTSAEADPITVAELPQMPGVIYLTPSEETIFSLVVTRAAVEEEEVVEVEEPVEAEPELIRRGKEEGEDEG